MCFRIITAIISMRFAIGIYTTCSLVFLVSLFGRLKIKKRASVKLCACQFRVGSLCCHLQAVVLSELVLLLLGQVADEAIEVGNHILVCHECLYTILSNKFTSVYISNEKYLVEPFERSLVLGYWQLA